MLLKKVDLLESQTQQYKELVRNYEQNDSLNLKLLETNKTYYLSKISALNDSLKKETKKRKFCQLGMLGISGLGILALFLTK
jgi:hypothetical protein